MANEVGATGSALLSKIFGSILWLGIGVIIIAVVGFILWYFGYYKRKFDIKVMIKSEREGDRYSLLEDKAAILFNNKERFYFLRLADTKIDLPAPPYMAIQRSNKGDVIELWRKSEDEFIYLTPGTINKKIVMRVDGSLINVAQIEQKQLEGDIAYWNVKRKGQNKKLFDKDSILMKMLEFAPQIIGGMILIFILWILFDKLPAILSQLSNLVSEMRTMKQADIITYGLSLLSIKKWKLKN